MVESYVYTKSYNPKYGQILCTYVRTYVRSYISPIFSCKVTIVCQDDSEKQCLQSFNSNQVCCKVGESNMKAIRFLKVHTYVNMQIPSCYTVHTYGTSLR